MRTLNIMAVAGSIPKGIGNFSGESMQCFLKIAYYEFLFSIIKNFNENLEYDYLDLFHFI